MKKVMFLMAVAGMFAFAACNNNNNTEATEDTTACEATEMEAPAEDECCANDSTVEMPAEETETPAAE